MIPLVLSDYFSFNHWNIFTFYVSAQFHGSGKILNTIFGIEPLYGITLSAIIIIIYTILGGYWQ